MYFVFGYLDADAPIELRNVTMLLEDGASASVEFTFDSGDFQYTVAREWNYRPNRGKLGAANGASVTQGDDQPMALSFQGRYSRWTSVGDTKPNQILFNIGGGFTSTESRVQSFLSFFFTVLLLRFTTKNSAVVAKLR